MWEQRGWCHGLPNLLPKGGGCQGKVTLIGPWSGQSRLIQLHTMEQAV